MIPLRNSNRFFHINRKKYLHRLDPGKSMFRTHAFAVSDSPVSFSNRSEIVSFEVYLFKETADAIGVLFSVGDGTRAATLAVNGTKLYFAAGTYLATPDDGALIDVTAAVPAVGKTYKIVASVSVNTGELFLWVDGRMVAKSTAVSGDFGVGDYAGSGDLYLASAAGSENDRIASAARVNLANATISNFGIMDNQMPLNRTLLPPAFVQLIPDTSVFYDDFEDGTLTKWTGSTGSFSVVNSPGKFGDYYLEYDIVDTTVRNITNTFGDLTGAFNYTYLYLRVGSDFTLSPDGRIVFMIAYEQSPFDLLWQLELRNSGGGYKLLFYNYFTATSDVYSFANLDYLKNNWIPIRVCHNRAVSGSLACDAEGNEFYNASGDYSTKDFGQLRIRFQSHIGVSGKLQLDHIIVAETDIGFPPY